VRLADCERVANFDSTAKEFILGLFDPGAFAIEVDQDNSDAGQLALMTALVTGVASLFLSAKVFVPMMRKNKWGRIVNLSSTSIVTNVTGVSHYMATKMGVIGFTRGLANDLGKDFITVNAVAPALTATPGTSHLPDAVRDRIVDLQAFKRMAVPNDIVGPILFLTSADAQFMTGQVLAVDGGMMKVT
jgi:NAD(P)-dependent dehydrogenase (short-subunit alcohol dehydrogenase family)